MTRTAVLLLGAALALPLGSASGQNCGGRVTAQSWAPPLNRRIPLRARDVSLREALDRVAAAARFRISYSAEFLPLDRHVCLSADSVVAGDALAELLAGVNVAPVVTGVDQVVIAPTRPVSLAPRESVPTLERVVVTGSAGGNARRPLSVAVDVVGRREVESESSTTLANAFDSRVAGLWLWEQSPSSMRARYGSIRGASSFGLSYPKVYIDGIEVANPLLLTDLNPASLDRIEVIRGPQGAALYGADAISGVVNIVTRHEGLQSGASRAELVSRAGVSQTSFAARSVLAQNHSLDWRTGSNRRSGSLGMSIATLGGYVPEAYSRDVKLNGGLRVVTQNASVTGFARVASKRAALGDNPLIAGLVPSAAPSVGSRLRANFATAAEADGGAGVADSLPQTVQQYTLGVTSTLLNGTTWVPSFSAGVDGYRLANVPGESLIPSALDSALNSAEGGAHRLTFRTSVVGQYELGTQGTLGLTFAGEHSNLNEMLVVRVRDPLDQLNVRTVERDSASIRSTTGFVAQANFALQDAVYFTGGARVEQNHGFTTGANTVLLPMVGVAGVREVGSVTIKGRAAYGVGVRPARSSTRNFAFPGTRYYDPARGLEPERQSGVEFGADLFYDQRFALHVTRFDQTATNLIQSVAISSATGSSTSAKGPEYVLQNVGEITNRGWELESSYDVRYFSLAGTFTTVDSRVQRIATNYDGDLRPGDRVLAVPAATASLTASWNVLGWRAGVTATRAFDWINYDRLAVSQDYASCDSLCLEMFTGPRLRHYWTRYDGVTRLRASLERDLARGFGLRMSAENLTNAQRGEPDNLTVLPGRTVWVGMSARLR